MVQVSNDGTLGRLKGTKCPANRKASRHTHDSDNAANYREAQLSIRAPYRHAINEMNDPAQLARVRFRLLLEPP